MDQDLFARLAENGLESTTRRIASIVLELIARERGLTPSARGRLLGVGGEQDPDLAGAASDAIAADLSFSRKLVLAALESPSPAYRPLLQRLAVVATLEDLPLLQRLMHRFGESAGPEAESLIEAALRLPPAQGEEQLMKWLDEHSGQRASILRRVLGRPSPAESTLARLNASPDRYVRLFVSALRPTAAAPSLLPEALRSTDAEELHDALRLAALVSDPAMKPQLKSLVNFRDDTCYPADALVRNTAMKALLAIAMDEAILAQTSEPRTGASASRPGRSQVAR